MWPPPPPRLARASAWRWTHLYARPVIGLLILYISFLLLMYFDIIHFSLDLLNAANRIFWI